MIRFPRFFIVASWCVGGCIAFWLNTCAAEITISLRHNAAVNGARVTIKDVANIHGGTTTEQKQLGELDLDVLGARTARERLTRREIEMRLLVAGYRRNQFYVTGAETVEVRRADTDAFRTRLEKLFHSEFARQFGFDDRNISIRIIDHQRLLAVESKMAGEDFAATVLFESQLPIGATTIQVEFASEHERFLEDFKAQVIVSTEVAIAARNVTRGSVIDASAVRVIRRPIVRKADFADPKQIVGRVAKVDILSNEVMLTSYLTEVNSSRTAVIQRNDLIDVIVRLGNSEIRLKNARALGAGNIGDTVTVLNTESNRQLTATIVARQLAIVSNSPRKSR
ncbi:MAG: flagellar basal body P-ring formation chaperone FlgA [Planctomycetota bacterium]